MELDQLKQQIIDIIEPIIHREVTIDVWKDNEFEFKRDPEYIYLKVSIKNKGIYIWSQIVFLKEMLDDMYDDSYEGWIRSISEQLSYKLGEKIQNQKNDETT